MSDNIMQFIFDLFDKFVGLIDGFKTFLFSEINILGMTISVWQFIGGGAVVGILIAIVVKVFL